MKKKTYTAVAVAWVAGLCLMGSDGELFPIPNLIGLIPFGWACLFMMRKGGGRP